LYQARNRLLYPHHAVQSARHRYVAGRLFVGFV
jgi:hypothetical protein